MLIPVPDLANNPLGIKGIVLGGNPANLLT